MPINNMGKNHLTATQQQDAKDVLATLFAIFTPVSQNLTDEERSKYGSINETNKLLVDKANDYHTNQPELQSPDVDWKEFDLDYKDRKFTDTFMNTWASLGRLVSDFKIVHDFDNYQDTLTDYSYSQYKANTNTPGYTEKVNEMKQFFPNSPK